MRSVSICGRDEFLTEYSCPQVPEIHGRLHELLNAGLRGLALVPAKGQGLQCRHVICHRLMEPAQETLRDRQTLQRLLRQGR